MTTPASMGEWSAQAACGDLDPAMFYPELGTGHRQAAIARAKAVCFACPVWRDCLDYAMERHIADGIWGGLTGEERWGRSLGSITSAASAGGPG